MTQVQNLLTALTTYCHLQFGIYADTLSLRVATLMAHAQDLLAHFANCNLHLCIYGAFGLTFLWRAVMCKPEHNPGEARENFVHGMVYLCLGLLK